MYLLDKMMHEYAVTFSELLEGRETVIFISILPTMALNLQDPQEIFNE